MGAVKILTNALVLACAILSTVESRKSFVVKEKINNGEIKVASPRVMAYDC